MPEAGGKQPRVLIADDDADIRALVGFRLERAGCEVMRAADGEQALRMAEESPPDLRARAATEHPAYEAGADGFLAKPFSPQELASRVERALAGDGDGRHPRA